MRHWPALLPYIFLAALAVLVVFVMALSSACSPPPTAAQRIARKQRPDYLGQAILDSQNYHAPRQQQ